MIRQRYFAAVSTLLIFLMGILFWYSVRETWLLVIFIAFGTLNGISILTWQIIAPDYAKKLFGLEPYRTKHSFWLSTIIVFGTIVMGFFPIIYFLNIHPISYLLSGVFALLFALMLFARNKKYYKK